MSFIFTWLIFPNLMTYMSYIFLLLIYLFCSIIIIVIHLIIHYHFIAMGLQQVMISAHIPPGYFERWTINPLFYTDVNDRYVQLIHDFAHVIAFQVYGHTHTDSFRIFADNSSIRPHLPISPNYLQIVMNYLLLVSPLTAEIQSAAFLAPSVTPWLPGGGVNPGLRLYQYSSYRIEDYWQYYLNLSTTMQEMENASTPEWHLLYRATTTYQVPDMGADSLVYIYTFFFLIHLYLISSLFLLSVR